MTDEMLHPDDALQPAVAALRAATGVVPGLPERTARRRRRQRRRLIGSGIALPLALVSSVLLLRSGAHDDITTFTLVAPASSGVSLVGDFTEWETDRIRLEPAGHDRWQVKLKLPPGRYRFAYVTDEGNWLADADAPPVLDEFGSPTSVITVLSE